MKIIGVDPILIESAFTNHLFICISVFLYILKTGPDRGLPAVFHIRLDAIDLFFNSSNFSSHQNSGEDNIAEMWKNHFAGLYNSVTDNGCKDIFYDRVKTRGNSNFRITPQDVSAACRQQKKGKSAGPDGLHMEAFVYSCYRLSVHLSVLFSLVRLLPAITLLMP